MADKKINVLSDEDLRVLKALIDKTRSLRANLSDSQDDEDESSINYQSTDCYIAKIPTGGIAAINTSGADPIISSANCAIYNVNKSGTTYKLKAMGTVTSPYSQLVYNLSITALAAGYTLVVKEKTGIWVATPSGGIETRVVQVDDGSSPDGTAITPNAGCIWPGFIVGLSTGVENFCADPWSSTPTIDSVVQTAVPIWITNVDKPGGSGSVGTTLIQKDRYLARFLEDYTLVTTTKPLYAIDKHAGSTGASSGIVFQLYTEMLVTDVAQANVILKNWWGHDPGADPITVQNLPSKNGGTEYVFYGPTGAYGIAEWDDNAGVYRITALEHQALLIAFELTSPLIGGGPANASRLSFWDGADPGSPVQVYDTQGLFPLALAGALGLARWDNEFRIYEVIECESMAGWVVFQLYENLSSGLAQATVIRYGGTQQDRQDPSDASGKVTVADTDHIFRRAKTGDIGLGILDVDSEAYIVFECESKAGAIRFTTGTTITATPASVEGYQGTQQDTKDPGNAPTIVDPANFFQRAQAGAKAIGLYDNINDIYLAILSHSKAGAVKFQLSADMSSGSATAGTISSGDYWGTQQDIQAPGSITVYDNMGFFTRAKNGAQGIAIYSAPDDKYYIVACDQLALILTGTLGSTLTSSTSTVTLSSPTVGSPKPFSQAPSGTVTVDNDYKLAGASGAKALAVAKGSGWVLEQVEHVAQSVLTDIQYDTSGHKIQVKTRVSVSMWDGAESGWTDKITFVAKTFVTDVNWTDPTLSKVTFVGYVPEAGSNTTTTVDTPITGC